MTTNLASFRGVPFKTRGDTLPVGPRAEISEFPYRNKAYGDEFGTKAKVFSINAFVIGKNWAADRDALIAALDAPGGGELIHPQYGRKYVMVTGADVTHSSDEQGMASFALQFTEIEAQTSNIIIDTQSVALLAANNLAQIKAQDFAQNIKTSNAPIWVLDNAKSKINDAQNYMEVAARTLNAKILPLNKFTNEMRKFNSDLVNLFKSPANLIERVFITIENFAALARGPQNAIAALKSLSQFAPFLAKASNVSKTNNIAIANNNLIVSAIAYFAISHAAKIIIDWDFETYEDAINARKEFILWVDEISLNSADLGDLNGYEALIQIRSAIIKDIDLRGAALPRLLPYSNKKNQPAITLAYDLFGAVFLQLHTEDLIARNKLPNPLFVPDGIILEVLND